MTLKLILGMVGAVGLVAPWLWLVLEKRAHSKTEKSLAVARQLSKGDKLTIEILAGVTDQLRGQLERSTDEKDRLRALLVSAGVDPGLVWDRLVLQGQDREGPG